MKTSSWRQWRGRTSLRHRGRQKVLAGNMRRARKDRTASRPGSPPHKNPGEMERNSSKLTTGTEGYRVLVTTQEQRERETIPPLRVARKMPSSSPACLAEAEADREHASKRRPGSGQQIILNRETERNYHCEGRRESRLPAAVGEKGERPRLRQQSQKVDHLVWKEDLLQKGVRPGTPSAAESQLQQECEGQRGEIRVIRRPLDSRTRARTRGMRGKGGKA